MLISETLAELSNTLILLSDIDPVSDLGTNRSILEACQLRGEAYTYFGQARKHSMKMVAHLEQMNMHLDDGEELAIYTAAFDKARCKALKIIGKCARAMKACLRLWTSDMLRKKSLKIVSSTADILPRRCRDCDGGGNMWDAFHCQA